MKNISKEDYLSAIYKFRDENGEIKPNLIAESLEISNAAVTDMLRKLSKDGFVIYKKYKGIRLTADGENYAKNMIRRHRIWETFLHQVLGMPWDKVHDEAEKLEHSSSDELINRIEEYLDYPESDPHGYPIPDRKGKMPKHKNAIAISELYKNDRVEVIRVNDTHKGMLGYISKIGVELGKEIVIKDILKFDGSMLLKINNKDVNISKTIASNIFVEKIEG
ncbi:MAG TPA: metal-dependent transcriptional regulator [Ignavibacteriaceae bacterium]|nr:metal-dependent transcriptional regulator [Ignavibacteriaceae bacterium]